MLRADDVISGCTSMVQQRRQGAALALTSDLHVATAASLQGVLSHAQSQHLTCRTCQSCFKGQLVDTDVSRCRDSVCCEFSS